jgi:hypothetical protein
MNNITVVRIYLTEGDPIQQIIDYLYQTAAIKGLTVFRGIEGFGDSHQLHTAHLVDLEFQLPIVIEFFDRSDKVNNIMAKLTELTKTGHIISWPAMSYR